MDGAASVAIDGLTIHVDAAGEGPPLVLLHGFTGSSDTWRDLIGRLAGEYRTIAPDLVGHARSDAPEAVERYAIRRAAADLVALLRALGHERAAWLGYSLGGRVALQVAADHPQAVAALVLEGASPGIADAAEREARRASDEALAQRIERDGVEAFVDEWEAGAALRLAARAARGGARRRARDAARAARPRPRELAARDGRGRAGAAARSAALDRRADAAAGRFARREVRRDRAGIWRARCRTLRCA